VGASREAPPAIVGRGLRRPGPGPVLTEVAWKRLLLPSAEAAAPSPEQGLALRRSHEVQHLLEGERAVLVFFLVDLVCAVGGAVNGEQWSSG
jgi:hypothetical protein